jgi:hypothetical protein
MFFFPILATYMAWQDAYTKMLTAYTLPVATK